MDNVKITATFTLPGRVKNPTLEKVHTLDVQDKKGKFETLKFTTSEYTEVNQTINMSQEAYEGMMTSPCNGIPPKKWKTIPKALRVMEHLKAIKHDLHASHFTFVIYDD